MQLAQLSGATVLHLAEEAGDSRLPNHSKIECLQGLQSAQLCLGHPFCLHLDLILGLPEEVGGREKVNTVSRQAVGGQPPGNNGQLNVAL